MKKNIVKINEEKCKECGLCVVECKEGIIKISENINEMGYHPAKITDISKCTGCISCAIACPEAIIEVIREES